jgi:hypothetical protein
MKSLLYQAESESKTILKKKQQFDKSYQTAVSWLVEVAGL